MKTSLKDHEYILKTTDKLVDGIKWKPPGEDELNTT